jgi:predicted RNA polymerase sigma factor
LYETLDRVEPNPMATLNRAVATAMVHGPLPGLALLATLEDDDRVRDHHLLFAVRGHLLDMAACAEAASDAYRGAARRTASVPEKRYLEMRAAQVLRPPPIVRG